MRGYMRIVMLLTIYIVEVLKYCIGYYVCFNEKVKRKWGLGLGIVICLLVVTIFDDMEDYQLRLIIYILVLCIMAIVLSGRRIIKIFRLFAVCFLLVCMDEIFGLLIQILSINGKEKIVQENSQYLLASVLSFITLNIIMFCKRSNKHVQKGSIYVFMTEKLKYLVILMALEMLFTIAGLNFARNRINDVKFSVYAICVTIIAYISVGIVGVFTMYIKNVNEKMKEAVEQEIALKDMQKRYYEALLEKEEDTRKYRHDMMNHFLCLNAFVEEQNYDALQEYLIEMQGKMEEIQKRCYVTGNRVLDVITNYYLGMLEEDIDIRVCGMFDENIGIDDMQLCTIYANLLQNAVEELLHNKEAEEKFIRIEFLEGKEYFQIKISNSISDSKAIETEEFLSTWKSDKKNHGIGLQNVRKTIEMLDGKFEIAIEEKVFEVKATFKVDH